MQRNPLYLPVFAALLLAGCATAPPPATAPAKTEEPKEAKDDKDTRDPNAAYASTYKPMPSGPVLITNATILTAAGDRIERGSILLQDGKIAAVGGIGDIGGSAQAPAGATVVDATGKWVTPGLIDAHSHLGVYAAPGDWAHEDGNEMTNPVTAEVWAEHAVWPQDPQFPLSLAGGVTAMQILPGSGNLIGGRSVTIKNVPARHVDEMKFPGAPHGLKMACGENPKRVYGEDKGRAPMTRMGNVAGYRRAWIDAAEYRRSWDEFREKKNGKDQNAKPPGRDLAKETLAGVLAGEILIQNHCYRADEMLTMIDIAREFGYKITAFHHAVEAYKIADVLAREGICSDIWADSWGFKLEALDGIPENAAILHKAGACVVIHSDSAQVIQRLNQEAAKAMAMGHRMGVDIRYEDAIRWITINPAKSIGVGDQTGSLEVGKMADVVLWSGDPFSVYSRAEKVWIDGALAFDRNDPAKRPRMDFELGLIELEETGGDR